MNYKIKNKLADNLIKANSHLKRKATIKRSKSIVTNRIKRTPIDTINVNRVHVKRVPINKININ